MINAFMLQGFAEQLKGNCISELPILTCTTAPTLPVDSCCCSCRGKLRHLVVAAHAQYCGVTLSGLEGVIHLQGIAALETILKASIGNSSSYNITWTRTTTTTTTTTTTKNKFLLFS